VQAGEVVPGKTAKGLARSCPTQAAVGAVVIVEVAEPRVGSDGLGFGEPGSDVGPLLQEDPMDRSMLLCLSSGAIEGRSGVCSREGGEHLPSDVALQASDDLSLGESLGQPPTHIGLRPLVDPHSRDHDHVKGRIRLAVAPSIQSVALGLA